VHLLFKKLKRLVIGHRHQRHRISLVNGDTRSAVQ
jgi:hypothetical protein